MKDVENPNVPQPQCSGIQMTAISTNDNRPLTDTWSPRSDNSKCYGSWMILWGLWSPLDEHRRQGRVSSCDKTIFSPQLFVLGYETDLQAAGWLSGRWRTSVSTSCSFQVGFDLLFKPINQRLFLFVSPFLRYVAISCSAEADHWRCQERKMSVFSFYSPHLLYEWTTTRLQRLAHILY